MLPGQQTINLSEYSKLYDIVVPKDNMLRQINDLVDFSFIFDELKDKYCHDNGRNAKDPIMLFKYLLLKVIHKVSDVDIVERSKYDMSFKYFLGMTPEEEVIDPSLLTVFRKKRLQDINFLDLLINKTVQIAIEKGIVKSGAIIVDSTHTDSRFNQKSPKEVIQERAKQLRKAVYEVDENMKENLPAKSSSNELEAEIKYCEELVDRVEEATHIKEFPRIKEKLNYLKEGIEDQLDNLPLSADPDAKVGHKSTETSFFGYKTHLAMTKERIISAGTITPGNRSDGKQLRTLIEKSKAAGINVNMVIGDTAYSGTKNILYANRHRIKLVSKLHPVITQGTRKKEDEFDFNKDAGMYVCKAGHLATRKQIDTRKNSNLNTRIKYFFDIKKCKVCPFKEGCYQEGAKSKTYSVTLKSHEQEDQARFQNSEEFRENAKERYKIEAKNSELKHRHGYNVSSTAGLIGMELQGAMTIFAVNIKRILKLMKKK
jgi:transposase